MAEIKVCRRPGRLWVKPRGSEVGFPPVSCFALALAERALAKKYALHFVGDTHQPLHASDNQDRGDDCVPALLCGHRTSNLHSFWDTIALAPLGDGPAVIAKTLEADITPDEAKVWSAVPAEPWAEESYAAAKADTDTIGSPLKRTSDRAPIPLSDVYQAHALAAAKTQIDRAAFGWLGR